MSTAVRNFKQLSRVNTGRHMLDSGDIYGRQYEKPLPKELVYLKKNEFQGKLEFSAYIACGEFLDTTTEINSDVRRKFKAFCRRKDQRDSSWYENVYAFAESLGLEVVGDNTYNHENDLDQEFQFLECRKPGEGRPEFTFIQTHNGCDVRGGYSEPIPVNEVDEYSYYETAVGWSFSKGTDANGKALTTDELQALDEHFQVGYTSAPSYEFGKAIAEVLEVDENEKRVKVKLKSGETIIAYPNCRAEYL